VLTSFESARATAADLKFKLEASQNKEQERLRQYNALEVVNKNLLVRVAAAEGEVGALKNDISHLQEKDAGMLHEIDSLHSELDSLSKQRQHENDIWAEKYVALQSLHESSSQDATSRFNVAIEDAKRRISDASLDRDRVEEQFHKMQAVNLSLNSTLEKHRSEHNLALEAWVATKKDLEDQLQVLRRTVSGKDAEIDARRMEEARNRANDLQKIKDLKQSLSDRSTSFVEVLGNTQKTLKSLHQEVAAGKAKLMDVGNQALLLKNFCLQLQSKLSLPVNKLQPEIERVFEILFEKMSGLNSRHDSSQDDVASLRVAIEEEKSRAVLAEEEVSRVERRLATAISESKAEITKVQQDLSEAQKKLRASESDRGDVVTRLQRAQEALEAVSTQAHTLQLENQKLQACLRDISSSDTSTAQNAIAAGLNEKVEQMTVLLKQAGNDRVDKEQKILNLQEQIKTMTGNLKSLDEKNQYLKQSLAQKEKELISSKGSANPSPSLAEQQYLLQLKQTQEILRV
jgi:chromosome segregation ATPase